jgi:hypothetical protein
MRTNKALNKHVYTTVLYNAGFDKFYERCPGFGGPGVVPSPAKAALG